METFTFESLISTLTVIFSILVKIIGFPDQAKKIYLKKSSEGQSLILYALSFTVYILWTIYGILKNDWVIIGGQILGVITTGFILLLLIKYSRQNNHDKNM